MRLTKITARTMRYNCGSVRASNICLGWKVLLWMPVLLTLTCFNSATFSASVSHLACMGVSGTSKSVARPMATVTHPKVMNMIRHPASPVPGATCWKPYEIAPPMIWPKPSPQYQKENLGACSDLVYHCELIRSSEGPIVASKMPRKTRETRSVR